MFVETTTGEIINLRYKINDTIQEIKEKIQGNLDDAPKERQCLFFKGKELNDEKSCSFYSIVNKSTVFLNVRHKDGMQIKVNMPNTTTDGQVAMLEVLRNDTIKTIKEKVTPLCRLPQKKMLVTFDEKVLQDDLKTLEDYNIQNNSSITITYSYPYKVKIKMLNPFQDCRFAIMVEPSDTIKQLKSKIHEAKDIPPDQQLLILRKIGLKTKRPLTITELRRVLGYIFLNLLAVKLHT